MSFQKLIDRLVVGAKNCCQMYGCCVCAAYANIHTLSTYWTPYGSISFYFVFISYSIFCYCCCCCCCYWCSCRCYILVLLVSNHFRVWKTAHTTQFVYSNFVELEKLIYSFFFLHFASVSKFLIENNKFGVILLRRRLELSMCARVFNKQNK